MGSPPRTPNTTHRDGARGVRPAARRILLLGSLTLFVAGCTTTSLQQPASPQQPTVWARQDGQRIRGNPELEAQGRADEAACRTEATDADGNLAMAAMEACMDGRGYRIIILPPGETYVPVAAPAAGW